MAQAAHETVDVDEDSFDLRRDPDAFERFHSMVADTLMPYDRPRFAPDRTSSEVASIRRTHLPGATVVEHDFPGALFGKSGIRTRGNSGQVGISVLISGQDYIGNGRSEVTIRPGDVYVVAGARPGTFRMRGRVRTLTVLVDSTSVPHLTGHHLTGHHLTRFSSACPNSRLVRSYLRSMASELPNLSASAARSTTVALMELLTLLGEGPRTPEPLSPLRVALLPVVRDYIEQHLGCVDLTPASIAAAHAVSLRTLHAVFSDSGESVARFVRRRRLESGYVDLLGRPGLPVAAVAARSGFTNAGNFPRAFRGRYGLSPTDLRRGAGE